MKRRRGKLITFEGVEGSGKSTHAHFLAERMKAAGHRVVEVREPGGTHVGEVIRRLLSKKDGSEVMCPQTELLLFMASRAQLAAFSSSLKELALELIRIANDLRLLGSGPTTGLAEIRLPAVQPGSSIMPGKVNPVMAECLNMIAFQVIGNDTAVGLATQAGQLELNVMTPVIIHNILMSVSLLCRYLPVFTGRCVEGIEADEERCRAYLRLNPSLATLLSSRIGYLEAAGLAEEALEKRMPVSDLAVEKGLLTPEEARQIFDPDATARSHFD